MKIAYLGPEGTFTHEAVSQAFPNAVLEAAPTIRVALQRAEKGEVDGAFVPLENTLEGTVSMTIDYLFHESTSQIEAEFVLPIAQHLLVSRATAREGKMIHTVVSHPHALAQCHTYLHQHHSDATWTPMNSTAAAASWVLEHAQEPVAAIATMKAAAAYSLVVQEENIHDSEHNHTRFVFVSKKSGNLLPNRAVKTTIMVTLPEDRPGGLHSVLSAFAWRGLNLSKIESRPLKTKLGSYFFMIDIEANSQDVLLQGALAEVKALGCEVKDIGCYAALMLEG